jgi:hypothetical protein
MMTRLARAIAILGLGLVPASPAHAQFSAAPAIVRLGASADAELAVVRVRNEGAVPSQFRLYLSDYDQNESGDFRFAEYGSGRGTCGDRLSAYPEAAYLEPGATQEIRVRLAAGATACWGVLFVESSHAGTGPVRVAQRIGVRIVDSRRAGTNGEVEDVSVLARPDSLEVDVVFANLGLTPAELRGSLEIRSLQTGELVRTAGIGPLGVLPGSRRRIPLRVENGLPPGRYVVVPVIDFGADFLAGGQTQLVIP